MSLRAGWGSIAFSWVPPLVWAGILFALSSGKPPQVAPDVEHIDKVLHAGAYSVLGFLVARGALRTWPALGAGAIVLAGGLTAAIYGVTDEIHQSFTPGRFVEVADGVADTVGGFAGASAFVFLARRKMRVANG